MNVIKVYTLRVLFLSCVCFASAQDDGHSCLNKELSQRGNCLSIEYCPSAQESLKFGKRPQICGFKDKIPLVCCVEGSNNNKLISKSQQVCKQYEDEIKQMLNGDCPFINIKQGLIIGGGIEADNREFPHMVAIGYNQENSTKEYLCSGTLISKNFVLTAAHCLYSPTHELPKTARVGDLVLNSENDHAQPQEIKISKIHKHPDFKRPSKYNDIALLELEEDVKFSPYAYPACLHTTEKIEDYFEVITTGWGNTNAWGDPSDALRKAKINVIPHKNCTEFFQITRVLKNGIDKNTQICAASLGEKKDSCNGDSGGPLQKLANEFCMYNVLGVKSFGTLCLLSNSPAVYTIVFPYIDWIEKIVWP